MNLEQVQLVLDELCWRERFATSASHCYNNLLEHVVYLTSRETENPGLLHLLDYVAVNPQKNWRYKTVHVAKGPLAIQPAVINSNSSNQDPNVTVNQGTASKILIPPMKKIESTSPSGNASPSTSTIMNSVLAKNSISSQNLTVMTKMEPYFYGTIPGNLNLGQEPNTCEFKCHLCSETFIENIKFYTHIKWHISGKVEWKDIGHMCPYCIEPFFDEVALKNHVGVHIPNVRPHQWCRICLEQFENESSLLVHMTRKHVKAEIPYRCEVCQFGTSIHTDLIDHFNEHHRGTPYILCHLCLNVKCITPQGASSFSFRLHQHLQKHNQKNKCKTCLLTFYSKYMLQDHKNKDHYSCAKYKELVPYEIPADRPGNPIVFKAPRASQTNVPSADAIYLKPSVAMSVTLENQYAVVADVEKETFFCIECDQGMELEGHYCKYQKCLRCPYSTCCQMMISRHNQIFHPNSTSKKSKNRTLPYTIGPPIMLANPLICICGFSSSSGNHMARHLALCEGGRKSAYPSYANAIGVTENPSLDEYLAAARAISERSRETDSASPPPQDITPFMTMNMEVDDPPVLPLDVEIKEG